MLKRITTLVSAVIVTVAYSNTQAQDSQTGKTLRTSSELSETISKPVWSTIETPQPPANEREQRLAALGAQLEDEEIGSHGKSITLRGERLGRVDISIDAKDKASVKQEIMRFISTVKDFVGPVEELDIGNISLRRQYANRSQDESIHMSFTQNIDGIPVGRAWLVIVGGEVIRLRTVFVDADQPNADRRNWMDEGLIEARAKDELISHLAIDELDLTAFRGPEILFRIIDEDFTLKSIYRYKYSYWSIHVDALTLETHIFDRSSH